MDKLANITRQDLYDLTHAELGIPKSECSNFVDDLFAIIIQNLKKKILELEEILKQKRLK